jgi:starvation-inducible DNA-binding protein
MKTSSNIKTKNFAEISKRLNHVLADEFILYVKTLNAHWNVEGNDFYSMHLFFETQYKDLIDIIDNVAERIRTLGHYASATLSEYKELTHLSEQSRKSNNSTGFIEALLEDHISIIALLRSYIKDMESDLKDSGTNGFLSSLIEAHEKMAWKIRSHLPH